MESNCKVMTWVGRGISTLAVLPFVFSAFMVFSGNPQVVEGVTHLGWPQTLITTIGVLEAICVILYVIPPFSVMGAILITGYLGGAVSTHLRIGEDKNVVFPVVLGVLIWLGLFLREPRLRELLPVRSKDFKYEREVTINQSRDTVFAYLKQLRNFRNWNPFLKKDPQAKTDYHGTDGEVGFTGTWDGNREMGAGEQELTKIIEGQRIEFELRFIRPFNATNQGYFSVESVGSGQTKVKWVMMGTPSFPMSLFGLLINCDKMIGKEFESGLQKLKTILEK